MKITILTGAGISAESGLQTFRDADGLWEGHDVMEVASPQGWHNNQSLVLDFYNQRRRQLLQVKPNKAHESITELQRHFHTTVITQNVDDLHERAGNNQVLHLHGELFKVRSIIDSSLVYDWKKDLNEQDTAEDGGQLRPHIVWFGEAVPMIPAAIEEMSQTDLCIVVGTSMQVYPAASLTSYLPTSTKIIYIDPNPQLNYELNNAGDRLQIIREKATIGLPELVKQLISKS